MLLMQYCAVFAEDLAVDNGSPADFDPAKLTIKQLRTWLDDHNQQEMVWDLGQKNAKKAEYVQCVRELM